MESFTDEKDAYYAAWMAAVAKHTLLERKLELCKRQRDEFAKEAAVTFKGEIELIAQLNAELEQIK